MKTIWCPFCLLMESRRIIGSGGELVTGMVRGVALADPMRKHKARMPAVHAYESAVRPHGDQNAGACRVLTFNFEWQYHA